MKAAEILTLIYITRNEMPESGYLVPSLRATTLALPLSPCPLGMLSVAISDTTINGRHRRPPPQWRKVSPLNVTPF